MLCTDFGKTSDGLPTGDVFCTLLAAAIGEQFETDALYVDGGCAAKGIVTHADPAGLACGGLLTLVGAITDLSPELKAYALAAGLACDVGHTLGSWIETQQERQAAKAVWRTGKNALQAGQCLKFVTHGFPRGDDWLASPCASSDHGFYDLQPAIGTISVTGSDSQGFTITVNDLRLPPTLGAFRARFGPAATTRYIGYKTDPDCQLTWPQQHITAVFYHGYGGVTDDSCATASGTLTVDLDSGWRTDTGLSIGSSLSALRSVYPNATAEGTRWTLIKSLPPWGEIAVLAADVQNGHISSFSIAGPESWDE
ncbi:MAG: hypothetical protein ACLP8S_17230 [Solirubrobacteraceae bacterium]